MDKKNHQGITVSSFKYMNFIVYSPLHLTSSHRKLMLASLLGIQITGSIENIWKGLCDPSNTPLKWHGSHDTKERNALRSASRVLTLYLVQFLKQCFLRSFRISERWGLLFPFSNGKPKEQRGSRSQRSHSYYCVNWKSGFFLLCHTASLKKGPKLFR